MFINQHYKAQNIDYFILIFILIISAIYQFETL